MSEVIRFRVTKVQYGIDITHLAGESIGVPLRAGDWFTPNEHADGTVDDIVLQARQLTTTGFHARLMERVDLREGDVLSGRVTR